MFVRFYNADVHIYKLRKGTLVDYEGDLYHIQHTYRTKDGNIRLHLEGMYHEYDVLPHFVTWLES